MTTAFLLVRFRVVLRGTSVSFGVSLTAFLLPRLTVVFLAAFSAAGATASVRPSSIGSDDSATRSILGASGAEDGGPAGRLATRRRRCPAWTVVSWVASWVGSWVC